MNHRDVEIMNVEEVVEGLSSCMHVKMYDDNNVFEFTVSEELLIDYYLEQHQDEYINSFYYTDSFGDSVFHIDALIDEIDFDAKKLVAIFNHYTSKEFNTPDFKYTIS